ncbi:E3 ubiquitin-protein ligase RFWD3 isoform X1 [Prunus yedoensis var. nudiflora]|uniref:E3 ubiquitin-protein ligase RFWD3 isoform X1 n=1 Tax=Prunus yedoensis var. nudiflora TaxID=2094558 RepID=A0A314XTV1_PRUYE|nr:E3 ubiquitin-protein ligase RFWD3 isoform X1 [Prunus yedoensis var. nudiflora]
MLASNFTLPEFLLKQNREVRQRKVERSGEKRRRIGGSETSSLGGIGSAGGSRGSEWNWSEIGGLFCPICLDAWTNDGDHRIWFELNPQFLCPQCNQKYKMKDVRKLFVSQVVSVHEESQRRIRVLKDKCASLEEKVADYSKKEGEWIKQEVEQQLKVQRCIKVKHSDASRENILPAPPFFENNFSWQRWKHAFNSFKAFFDSGMGMLRSTDELLPLRYDFRGYETFRGAQVFPETVKALNKFFDNYGARLGFVLYGMDTTPYSDVTDHRLLCWRDAIRDTILLGLHVDFFLDTLKMRLVHAVFEVRGLLWMVLSACWRKREDHHVTPPSYCMIDPHDLVECNYYIQQLFIWKDPKAVEGFAGPGVRRFVQKQAVWWHFKLHVLTITFTCLVETKQQQSFWGAQFVLTRMCTSVYA